MVLWSKFDCALDILILVGSAWPVTVLARRADATDGYRRAKLGLGYAYKA
jgi:hypothetical protein